MLKRFGVSLEDNLLDQFDRVIGRRGFQNRSEAIRHMIRKMLVEEEWGQSGEQVIGAVSVVYNHETMGLARRLTKIQHEFHGRIVSSMHIHMDEHNCMETLVVRGKPDEVEHIANRLINARGVKHGMLFRTSVGDRL